MRSDYLAVLDLSAGSRKSGHLKSERGRRGWLEGFIPRALERIHDGKLFVRLWESQ